MTSTRPQQSIRAATDCPQREIARRMTQHNRHRIVLWGVYSRQYWAFPLFRAPPRTIVRASDQEVLTTAMREAELEATASAW